MVMVRERLTLNNTRLIVNTYDKKLKDAISIGEIDPPSAVLEKWQGIVNILAELLDVPAALITKIEPPLIKVFLTSESANNPFHRGAAIHINPKQDIFSFYCEKVFSTKTPLHIQNALEEPEWDRTLGPRYGLISYLGVPILQPDGNVFGTICVMDFRQRKYHTHYTDLLQHFRDLVESHLNLLSQQALLENKISELQIMDAELQRHRDHLEELVTRRTHELAEANTHLLLEIEERKMAEKELQESEARFRSLVENSLTGISIFQNHCSVYRNPEHERLLGAAGETTGRPYPQDIHPEDADKVEALYADLAAERIAGGETDFRFFPVDGRTSASALRWVQCRATLVDTGGGRAILTNMMDISRIKELEHLIRIEDKMSSLGRVATGIVHEIRNPLSAINMYLGALKAAVNDNDAPEKEDPETVIRIAAQIQAASNKMEAVIRKVMDFSKPSTPRRVSMNINASIEKALDLSGVAVRKAGMQLEKDLARDLPDVYADAHMMEEVFLNLINNAMQALANVNSPKLIRIVSAVELDSVIVTVSDSGPGVPPSLRQSIFDPFFTTKGDGSGIGLSLARRMVMDHGGSLSVSTSHWGGAAFTVAIPLKPEPVIERS